MNTVCYETSRLKNDDEHFPLSTIILLSTVTLSIGVELKQLKNKLVFYFKFISRVLSTQEPILIGLILTN